MSDKAGKSKGAQAYGFAGAGRPAEDGAARDLGAEALVLGGILEKVDKLHDLDLGLVAARHVGKLDLGLVLNIVQLGLGLAHVEDVAHAACAAATMSTRKS